MFALCEGMKWAHLPNAGGLYDQDPGLLDAFRIIFAIRAQHDKEEHDKRERENKKTSRTPRPSTRPRGRGR